MNAFDVVVCGVAIIAIVLGFNAGLLRSLATIFGYVVAAPLAVAVTPRVVALAFGNMALSTVQTWSTLCIVFIALGIAIGALLRVVVGEFVGPDVSLADRVAGAALGAARIALVAVLIVVIFDRVIPAGHEPQFLAGSRLRPYLSEAGQQGLRALPPEIEGYIDRLKQERGI